MSCGLLAVVFVFSAADSAYCEDKPESLSVVEPHSKRKLGELTRSEKKILGYTNAARKVHDKPALTAVSHLNVVAQRHAINMARQQIMKHTLDEKTAGDRLNDAGYQFTAYSENIAANHPNEKAVVESWMKSPGHRRNLLDEGNLGFTQIGIGTHRGNDGVWYCCQVFARPTPGKEYE